MKAWYDKNEREKDDLNISKLEKAYKKEKDPILKAEKHVHFYYFYEARRLKLLAQGFQRGAKDARDKKDYWFVEELVNSLYVSKFLGYNCPVCENRDWYAEKDWIRVIIKKTNIKIPEILKKTLEIK